jgi:oligosaccharide repeat unit polymerase
MALDFAILAVSILLLFNYRVSRSVLYPPFVFCFMWMFSLVVCRLDLVDLNPIHPLTFIVISIGALGFTLGGLLSWLIPNSVINTRIILAPKISRSNLPKVLLIGILLLALPYLLHHLAQAATSGSGTTVLERARSASVDAALSGETESDPVTIYFAPVAAFMSLLFFIEKRDRYFWMATAMAFLANFISGGRTGFLMLIAALSSIHLIKTGQCSLSSATKILRIPIAIFLCLYVVLIFINKNTSDLSGNAGEIVLFFVVSYIVGPLAALDHVLQHPLDYGGAPNHTFEFFLKLAASLHLVDYTPPPLFDQFIEVPFPTNVYTVYKFYLTDFGIWGCLICIFIIGLLQSALYRKAQSGSKIGLFLFSLSLYPLIMVIFDDLYFVTIGFYLRAFVFAVLYMNVSGMPLRILGGRHFVITSGINKKICAFGRKSKNLRSSHSLDIKAR